MKRKNIKTYLDTNIFHLFGQTTQSPIDIDCIICIVMHLQQVFTSLGQWLLTISSPNPKFKKSVEINAYPNATKTNKKQTTGYPAGPLDVHKYIVS